MSLALRIGALVLFILSALSYAFPDMVKGNILWAIPTGLALWVASTMVK